MKLVPKRYSVVFGAPRLSPGFRDAGRCRKQPRPEAPLAMKTDHESSFVLGGDAVIEKGRISPMVCILSYKIRVTTRTCRLR